MGETEQLKPEGERLRTAVRWIGETLLEHPERSRKQVITQAAVRFDLTPRECEFLMSSEQPPHPCKG
ncbi:MAG: hypothetical protein AB1568_17490 [Thermodesulfobacteriota bacterium]